MDTTDNHFAFNYVTGRATIRLDSTLPYAVRDLFRFNPDGLWFGDWFVSRSKEVTQRIARNEQNRKARLERQALANGIAGAIRIGL